MVTLLISITNITSLPYTTTDGLEQQGTSTRPNPYDECYCYLCLRDSWPESCDRFCDICPLTPDQIKKLEENMGVNTSEWCYECVRDNWQKGVQCGTYCHLFPPTANQNKELEETQCYH